jgi:DNA-binding MarR family transcriptional regulator
MDAHGPEQIAALMERIGRLLHADAHAAGLLPVQWEALRYLDRANRFSRTPAALTAYLGLTKGTVSQTLRVLEQKGLVHKGADPGDRRRKRLSLSADARRVLMNDPLAVTAAAARPLSARQQESLADALQSVLRARLAARQRRPFGLCRDCRHFARRHANGAPHYCLLLEEPLTEGESAAICHEQQPVA